MKQAARFWRMVIWGVVLLLLATPAGSWAGAVLAGQIVISADTINEASVSLAYNSTRQEYLAVWYNDRAGNDDIRAQRLSWDGSLLGGPFYISAGSGMERRYPDVAYNSVHDQYLIVWEQYNAGNSFYSIQARRVDGTGALLDAADITIYAGSATETPSKPAVGYAYTSDRYLVVWAEISYQAPILYSIFGQVVTETGALVSTDFIIASGTEQRVAPDLAYNRHANRYLVVWQQENGTAYDVIGRQVEGGGAVYGIDLEIGYYAGVSCLNPAVAAIPTTPNNTKFLVVWDMLAISANEHDIYGRFVAEDGTPGNDFWISWANGVVESSPAVVGSEANLQFFAAWRRPQGTMDQPIYGRAISYTGTLLGQEAVFSGVAADLPALASGPGGDFLTAWQDQPISATDTDIYGNLWGNRLYLPIVLR